MTAFSSEDPVLVDVTRQTDALLEAVSDLTDADVAEPSLCPGWTRGHVLTHVARNADALTRLLAGAAVGEQWPMYHEDPSREREIEAGAGRSIAELEADIEASADRFLATCADLPPAALDNVVRMRTGREYPARQVPWLRWREVVLHHLDLDTGFDLATAGPLVPRLLAESIEALSGKPDAPNLRLVASDTGRTWTLGDTPDEPALVVSGRSGSLVGWVSGRTGGDDLDRTPEGGKLPILPPWG